MDDKKQEPAMDNLPNSMIDWNEISEFIEDMLKSDSECRKGWKIIDDPLMTGKLQENSVVVLHILYNDLYNCFFKQRGERFEVWRKMEKFIRIKYNGLSDTALSRVIAVYHIDDR